MVTKKSISPLARRSSFPADVLAGSSVGDIIFGIEGRAQARSVDEKKEEHGSHLATVLARKAEQNEDSSATSEELQLSRYVVQATRSRSWWWKWRAASSAKYR